MINGREFLDRAATEGVAESTGGREGDENTSGGCCAGAVEIEGVSLVLGGRGV